MALIVLALAGDFYFVTRISAGLAAMFFAVRRHAGTGRVGTFLSFGHYYSYDVVSNRFQLFWISSIMSNLLSVPFRIFQTFICLVSSCAVRWSSLPCAVAAAS